MTRKLVQKNQVLLFNWAKILGIVSKSLCILNFYQTRKNMDPEEPRNLVTGMLE